jgi:hypothetical protein
MSDVETHPIQCRPRPGKQTRVSTKVSLAAYEVYCAVWSPQPALVTGNCRGGFGVGELVALLYARSFPREEWRARFEEACKGMDGLS